MATGISKRPEYVHPQGFVSRSSFLNETNSAGVDF